MAQEYDIVGGFIDPKALADVEKLSNLYATAAENATKLIATADKKASQIGKEALMVEKLAALEQKTAEAKNKAAVAEEKRNTELLRAQRLQQLLDNQQSAAEAKRTKAAQDQTGYLNSLKAQVKDLTDQYMRLSEAEYKNAKNGTAGTLGATVIENLKKQRIELAQAEQAYGNYTKNVGNYSSANKMFGINIGQVLKEIPNFAISARIGIMSLTNNLPMLAESFKMVRDEQKALRIEQQKLVDAGKMQASEMTKTASVWKLIAQGIFSLTGVMSILMVVFQAFGPAMIEWTSNLFKGAQGLADMKKEAEGLITTLDTAGEFKKGLENVANMDRMFKAAASGGVKEGKQAVDEFNKTFNDTNHIFTSVNEAQDYFIANKDRYVKAMYEMAMSNHYMNKAVEKGVELEKLKSESDKPSMGLSGLLTIAGVSPSKMSAALKAQSDIKISAAKRELDAILRLSNEYYISSKKLYNLSEFDKSGRTKKEKERNWQTQGSMATPSLLKKTETIKPDEIDFSNLIKEPDWAFKAQSIRSYLDSAAEMYQKGEITYKEFEDAKIYLTKQSKDEQLFINEELQKKLEEIEKDAAERRKSAIMELTEIQKDAALQLVSDLAEIWKTFYENQNKELDEQGKNNKKVNDERIKDTEDRERAGVLTKKEAEDEKNRIDAYALGQEEEIERQRKENERNAFLISQAMSIAGIWMKYAETQQAIALAAATLTALTVNPVAGTAYGTTASALNLAQALAGTALAAAQTIPYFKDGGTMPHTGKAMLGDGGKHELFVTPDGKIGISNDFPTIHNLDAGTKIYPDINKLDMISILASAKGVSLENSNKELESILKGIRKDLSKQKHSTGIKGLSLVDQFNQSEKLKSKTRSLMN